ncbi:MAG TPA: peptidoglycan DD-metalloendopeptidase family protein, partial [Vicingus sp.]|nr:peptidoglycan DD-metalloendopeptidase family protein [Vicingus sp.]
FCSKDSLNNAQCFIYEPNSIEYVVFDLRDSIHVYKQKRPIKTEIRTASGVISSSLYKTLQDANISPVLAIELSNIFAWTIDFYRIQKDDSFKVIYEEKFVDDKSVGLGKIIAAHFNHSGKEFQGHYFEQNGIGDYFDEKANSVKKAFLKSPLKFGRLTSGFTMKRFHPVQKINKAHLGTDYAAPKGTPILATGNGVVVESSHGVFNGNYVKIRHNSTYTTQYLHMSKRAVKAGEKVKQGDVIGYVGSTGLATGPHVCYRFWKNGKQTNHLKEDFPTAEPIQKQFKDSFDIVLKENNKKFEEVVIKKKNNV